MAEMEFKTKEELQAAGMATGCLGVLLMGFGVLISVTVIGTIIGIPMIIMGFAMLTGGGAGTIGTWFMKGQDIICPYCSKVTKVTKKALTYICPECKKRVAIKEGKGEKIGE